MSDRRTPVTKRRVAVAFVMDRESRFVDSYLTHYSPKEAARAITPDATEESLAVIGWRYMKRERVQTLLAFKRTELSHRTLLTAEWLERAMMVEAQTATEAKDRLKAMDMLSRRVPDFNQVEQIDVLAMTPDQREKRKLAIIEQAAKRALAAKQVP